MKDIDNAYLVKVEAIREATRKNCSNISLILDHPLREEYYWTQYNRKKLKLNNDFIDEDLSFQNYMFYKALSRYQFSNFDSSLVVYDNSYDFGQQRIYTSGQFGSYRAISTLLVSKGIKLCAILADTAIEENGKQFKLLYKKLFANGINLGSYVTIDATDPKLFFKLKKLKSEGFSFLIFFDGDAGTFSSEIYKNLIQVNFLNKKFNVRKGIAYLSYILKIPIQPLHCVFEKNYRCKLNFGGLICPDEGLKREEYSQFVISKIWGEFEFYIRRYPEQWGVLKIAHQFYIEQFYQTKPPKFSDECSYMLNINRYKIIEAENPFLFDMENGIKYEISQNMLYVLKKIYENNLALQKAEFVEIFKAEDLQKQFIENEIFTSLS